MAAAFLPAMLRWPLASEVKGLAALNDLESQVWFLPSVQSVTSSLPEVRRCCSITTFISGHLHRGESLNHVHECAREAAAAQLCCSWSSCQRTACVCAQAGYFPVKTRLSSSLQVLMGGWGTGRTTQRDDSGVVAGDRKLFQRAPKLRS